MKLHNLVWYEENLVMKLWWEKQPPAEKEGYEAYWDINERMKLEEKNMSSLATEP